MNNAMSKLLTSLTSNGIGQRLLERIVSEAQYFMGIGSGGDVNSSGEAGILKRLCSNDRSRLQIFDVGANTGQFLSLTMHQLVRVSYDVHAFEPSKYTFNILSRNISAPNVILNNIALGKETGELWLYYDQPGSGLASLTKRRLDHLGIEFGQKELVKVSTLDDYCLANDISEIDLLKMDVEGHELDVLDGGSGMFRRSAVRMVAFEFGGCNIDSRSFFQDFFYFFQDHKMTILRVTPSGFLRELATYRESDEQFRTSNFLAVRNPVSSLKS